MKLSVFTGAAILASTALAELDPIIIKVRFVQLVYIVFDPTLISNALLPRVLNFSTRAMTLNCEI